jgi:hypothetical protein
VRLSSDLGRRRIREKRKEGEKEKKKLTCGPLIAYSDP